MRPQQSATWLFVFGVSILMASGCADTGKGKKATVAQAIPKDTLTGKVVDATGAVLQGATVYAIPAQGVEQTPINAANVLDGNAEAFDEPLEDATRESVSGMLSVTASSDGSYQLSGLDANTAYYVYADPGTASGYLPGGQLARLAKQGKELGGTRTNIVLSSAVPAKATYLGSTACIGCHAEYESQKFTAHKVALQKIGVRAKFQDISEFPRFDEGIKLFTSASSWNAPKVNFVAYSSRTPTRGFDKFITKFNDPATTACYRSYLWKNSADEYKITLVNNKAISPAASAFTLAVELTYGGAILKQRYLVKVGDLKGHYPFLQYQGYGAGSDTHTDRTRHVFRDYHMDWFAKAGTDGTFCNVDDTFGLAASAKIIEPNCMSCHAPGFTLTLDPATGKYFGTSPEDPNGEYDIDGDGKLEEINTGCETCHGPGSVHAAAATAASIVNPARLTPERSVQVCNACHDRAQGKHPDIVSGKLDGGNIVPINPAGERAMPGTSRATWLEEYTARSGPAISDFFPDLIHSKSHHQQSPDFIKSKHYRNSKQLLDCATCHFTHGQKDSTGKRQPRMLKAERTVLCAGCHGFDINEHQVAKLGLTMPGATCADCHMNQTAKTGAGRMGLQTAEHAWWENDLRSHVFDVPKKNAEGVRGLLVNDQMPIPYTRACALGCHQGADLLQFPLLDIVIPPPE